MSGLTYALIVNSGAYGQQSSLTALNFAKALVKSDHTLTRVFFYREGVSNASGLIMPANDELHIVKQWQELAKQHNVELDTCVAAALRRGIIGQEEAQLHDLPATNLAQGFTQAGLGSLSEALLSVDRVVQF